MEKHIKGAEVISLFCRLNMNTKRELPVRASEMGLLIFLVKSQTPPTPVEVARFFKISKPMVSTMIRSLTKGGYLSKIPTEIDRRSFTVCPTEKATRLVEETYDEYFKTMELLQAKMGLPDYENLIKLIKKANEVLSEE